MYSKKRFVIRVLKLVFPILSLSITLLQAASLEQIRARGVLRVAISEDYPILNQLNGDLRQGLEINLAYGFADFLGVQVELLPAGLTSYSLMLSTGEADIILGGLSRTLTRARTITFSEPYISVTPAALVDARLMPKTQFGEIFEEKPVRTLLDLTRIQGLKLGVKMGSAYEPLVQDWFPGYKIIKYSKNADGLNMLRKGEIQALVHDSLYLQGLQQSTSSLRNDYALLSGGRRVEVICAGFPFADLLMKNLFDTYVAELKRTGTLDRWLQEFSGK